MAKIRLIIPTAVFCLSFGIYVLTLNPSISAADSNEMVTTALVLGIPHQPSYPLSTLIGHLFSKIPFGPLPWRVNLMSAVFQAGAVTLIYFVILKLYALVRNQEEKTHNSLSREAGVAISDRVFIIPNSYSFLAAASALFLAFSLEIWQFANRAEVFALNNFWAALLTLILLSWWEKIQDFKNQESRIPSARAGGEGKNPESDINNLSFLARNSPAVPPRKTLQRYSSLVKHLPEEALRRWSAYRPPVVEATQQSLKPPMRLLYLFAFVWGLAFTHHQTIVLLIPALLFLLFWGGARFWFKKGILVKAILCFVLGVLPYLSLIPITRANPPIKWGEPGNLKGVFKALTRSDYGTFAPYAQHPSQIEGQPQKETPIYQQIFYLKSLNRDFTFLGLALATLGFFSLLRHKRRLFLFLFLGFFFAGPFFLGFANYTLDSGFHQAVARRFQMLPNLYFTLFLSFGFFGLWQKFLDLKLDFREKRNLLIAVTLLGGLSLSFAYPLLRNFRDADNRDNVLTLKYASDLVTPTPKNALILISGDVMTFAFEYWRTVVEPEDDRIVFSPGLLYLDWYVNRLKKNHPTLIIPPPQPGRIQASTTEVLEANWERLKSEGRPVYVAPELSRYDPEVGEKYVLWPRHLLFLVKEKGEDLRLEPYRAENEALWQSHDLALMEKIRKNNPLLEYAMIPEYARHHFNAGAVFESVHLYQDAIREYERALKIHPAFPDPYKNLGRVYGFKLKNKDYQKSFDNFNMFLATALPSQQEDVEVVKGAMGELYEEMVREATRSAQLPEASGSGKTATVSGEASASGQSTFEIR